MGNESEPPSAGSANERRRHPRHGRWFPVTLEAGGRDFGCICRDVSEAGMLVAARHEVVVGTALTLRFKLSPNDADERIVQGRVVRCERGGTEQGLDFPIRLGIYFDQGIEAFERGVVG